MNGRFFSLFGAAVVVLAVVAGIAVNPPGEVRARKLDARRVDDLRTLFFAVQTYWKKNKQMPSDIAALKKNAHDIDRVMMDPETGAPYEYSVTGETSYKLCAVFSRDTDEKRSGYKERFSEWGHGAGRWCFAFDAGKEGRPVPLGVFD